VLRTRTKGPPFSPGSLLEPGLKATFSPGSSQEPGLNVFSVSLCIYAYNNLINVVNCIVNKIIGINLLKNNSSISFCLIAYIINLET